jgi:hypothetical protein
MALTSEERKLIEEQKAQGKTKEQALSALADYRSSGPEKNTNEKDITGKTTTQKFTSAIGLGGAVDVFGSLLARQGVGPQTREQGQEFVEKPTGKQVAGAVVQTATIPAGAVFTGGGSLAGQVAAGAALGYLYDVGSDLAEGVEGAEAFRPGIETAAGAAIPVALRGVAGALRGVGTAAKTATESLPTSGLTQRAKEIANRIPRATRRVSEFVDEGAEIAKRKKQGTPQVIKALDEGINVDTIDFVQQFDDQTKQAANQMLDLADAGRGADLPQTIPGKFAGEQLELVTNQRKEIGKQIGEFSDSLDVQEQSVLPALRNLRTTLNQNGIETFREGVRFQNKAITPKQQKLVQEMYNLATQSEDLSPKQIYQMDQLFSKLQREARFEGIDDIFIKVPTAEGITEKNIYKVFRDVFSQQLDDIAEQAGRGDIKQLNKEYRTLRNLQDNVESTIVRQSKLEGINVDPSETASVALRRLFSNATSRAEYQGVYDQLDATSRAIGYEGPRADTLMDFYLTDVKPLYPETVPKTSFEGGITGAIGNIVEKISKVGAPNVQDQQKALRALLESN